MVLVLVFSRMPLSADSASLAKIGTGQWLGRYPCTNTIINIFFCVTYRFWFCFAIFAEILHSTLLNDWRILLSLVLNHWKSAWLCDVWRTLSKRKTVDFRKNLCGFFFARNVCVSIKEFFYWQTYN
jgi:hypothetical protein